MGPTHTLDRLKRKSIPLYISAGFHYNETLGSSDKAEILRKPRRWCHTSYFISALINQRKQWISKTSNCITTCFTSPQHERKAGHFISRRIGLPNHQQHHTADRQQSLHRNIWKITVRSRLCMLCVAKYRKLFF